MKSITMRTPLDRSNANRGFTLIELVVAMTVTFIVSMAVIANYISQEDAAETVQQVAKMQQQLRGAMYIMEQDMRLTGYDPQESGLFGVTDVRRYSITDEQTQSVPNQIGSPSLIVAYDWQQGAATSGDGLPNEIQPAYRLFDDNNDGILDLVRDDGIPPSPANPRPLLAEGIDAIGFAYAFDDNEDGAIDRTAGGNIIWAVDSDNDGNLDTNLDANGDGVIDLNDDTDGNYRITPADSAGGGLASPVVPNRIRMVRVWLLARARTAARDFTNAGLFILVGDQVVPGAAGGFNDNIRRRLLVRTMHCRNTGL